MAHEAGYLGAPFDTSSSRDCSTYSANNCTGSLQRVMNPQRPPTVVHSRWTTVVVASCPSQGNQAQRSLLNSRSYAIRSADCLVMVGTL